MPQFRYGLRQTLAPAGEPVSLAEVKAFLRIDDSDAGEEAFLSSLVAAARRCVENETATQLVTATYLWVLDSFFGYEMPGGQILLGNRPVPQFKGGGGIFPYISVLRFPRHPLVSVGSVAYTDSLGAPQTLDPSQYIVDAISMPGRMTPQYGTVWPVTREIPNAVQITFTAGFGDATAVPDTFKQVIKMLVGPWYMRREDPESLARMRLPLQFRHLIGLEDTGWYR